MKVLHKIYPGLVGSPYQQEAIYNPYELAEIYISLRLANSGVSTGVTNIINFGNGSTDIMPHAVFNEWSGNDLVMLGTPQTMPGGHAWFISFNSISSIHSGGNDSLRTIKVFQGNINIVFSSGIPNVMECQICLIKVK